MVKKILILCYISILLLVGCNKTMVESINLHPNSLLLSVGEKDTIEAFVNPIEAMLYDKIVWKSSNERVASVNTNGVVSAIYSGKCQISATVGKIKSVCNIEVKPIDIDMSFVKAAGYLAKSDETPNLNKYILRFFSDGYTIEPTGEARGGGYFLNMELYLPTPQTSIATARYIGSPEPMSNHFRAGYQYEQNGNTYVAGSYFARSSASGNLAIAIKSGFIEVTKNTDDYVFVGNFEGDNEENISLNYRGKLMEFDLTGTQLDTMFVGNLGYIYDFLGNLYNNGKNVVRLQLAYNATDTLKMEFVIPLSTNEIPSGYYPISNSNTEFTLMPSDITTKRGTIFVESGNIEKIIYGGVEVNNNYQGIKRYKIKLYDDKKRIFVNQN